MTNNKLTICVMTLGMYLAGDALCFDARKVDNGYNQIGHAILMNDGQVYRVVHNPLWEGRIIDGCSRGGWSRSRGDYTLDKIKDLLINHGADSDRIRRMILSDLNQSRESRNLPVLQDSEEVMLNHIIPYLEDIKNSDKIEADKNGGLIDAIAHLGWQRAVVYRNREVVHQPSDLTDSRLSTIYMIEGSKYVLITPSSEPVSARKDEQGTWE